MAETEDERTQILNFATQVGNPDTPPEETARNRGWIDDSGEITDEGHDVLKSLDDQDSTRTVFR